MQTISRIFWKSDFKNKFTTYLFSNIVLILELDLGLFQWKLGFLFTLMWRNVTSFPSKQIAQPVISSDVVKRLNLKMKPMSTRARDADNHPLSLLGEVELIFSCHCNKHKGKKHITKTALVLQNISEECLIPFDLSVQLDIITFNCNTNNEMKIQKIDIN